MITFLITISYKEANLKSKEINRHKNSGFLLNEQIKTQ